MFERFDHCHCPIGPDGTPYAYYEEFRDWALERETQVGWSENHGGFWLVVGYDECKEILQNPGQFSSASGNLPEYGTPDGRPLMLAWQDEPEHTRYRKFVQGPFSPGSASRLADQLRATTNDLIDGFIESGRVEVVAALANEVPARMTAIILGLPPEDGDVYRTWTNAMAHYHTNREEAAPLLADMQGYFDRMIDEHRSNPGDDVLSAVMANEVDGRRLTDQELKDLWIILLLGGIDNTAKILSNMLWRLAWDKELRRRLNRHPELIPATVDEFLRYYSPAHLMRVVTEPLTFHGAEMQAGQWVVLALPIANRDPRQFVNPDAFIADRAPNRHIALGVGIHRCLGAHLVKVEARVTAEEFLRRIPEFDLDTTVPAEWLNAQVGGMNVVPITFSPGGRALSVA